MSRYVAKIENDLLKCESKPFGSRDEARDWVRNMRSAHGMDEKLSDKKLGIAIRKAKVSK